MGEFLLRPQLIDSGVVTVSVEVDTEGHGRAAGLGYDLSTAIAGKTLLAGLYFEIIRSGTVSGQLRGRSSAGRALDWQSVADWPLLSLVFIYDLVRTHSLSEVSSTVSSDALLLR
jgi:hypothetical protein